MDELGNFAPPSTAQLNLVVIIIAFLLYPILYYTVAVIENAYLRFSDPAKLV